MPRQKQFDPEATLDAATQQFWEHGFASTSIDDLVRRTGLSRSSLYNTFRNKDHLFEQVLRRYDRTRRRELLARLEASHPPLAAIHELFQVWVRQALQHGDSRGCLLVNTATELGGVETGAGTLVADSQRDTEAFFRRLLDSARARGEISRNVDTRQRARALLAALLGLLVLIRSRPEKALLESVAASALTGLASPAGAQWVPSTSTGSPG